MEEDQSMPFAELIARARGATEVINQKTKAFQLVKTKGELSVDTAPVNENWLSPFGSELLDVVSLIENLAARINL